MTKLEKLVAQLESNIPFHDQSNLTISQGNVGWHIEHSLLTLNGITDRLVKSNPADYRWTFNFIRIMVFNLKKIPRGRAKSPEVVQPKGVLDQDQLMNHIALTKAKIQDLEKVSKDQYFEHPFFGKLKRKQTLDFLEIHTQHHLNIIHDIIG